MKKIEIVYFSIGCICVVLVPVMAFINLPVAFLYLIPAVIFFWLSRDIVKNCYSAIHSVLSSGSNSLKPKTVKKVTEQTGLSSKSDVKPEVKYTDNRYIESTVRKQFDNLDMITTSAIAIMLSGTEDKASSPFIFNVKKPDIGEVLLKFCDDSYFADDIKKLEELFDKSYYKWKIVRYFGRLSVFVKRGIGDSLPRKVALLKARSTRRNIINRICDTINTFESVKFISALSGNNELSSSKRNYKLDHLSENYKDALIYLVDFLLTCTCIAKMLFVERMIKNMDKNSEFYRIITNMTQSIDDHNLIINKSRPIYKQYYQSELGYINGDDLLYGMAITIMVNKIKKDDSKTTDVLKIDFNHKLSWDFNKKMAAWLDELSKDDNVEDIGTLILQKIVLSINDNYEMLISELSELTNWEDYYSQRVSYHNKERDRERYLKGDFEKEKEEIIKIR